MRHVHPTIAEFLSAQRIAVAGVSRDGTAPANLVYRKLKQTGHQVFAVNPNAARVEDDPCYPSVAAIPGGVEGVVIATHPSVAAAVVDDCAAAGVPRVWLHRSFGQGSVSAEAVARCRQHGITVIPGGCPMMYLEPVDPGHACMRGILRLTGRLPAPANDSVAHRA